MRLLRGVPGAVLWVVAALVGLIGVVLCVTVVLLPVGIPLLVVARRLLLRAVQLMLPRSVAHPVKGITKVAEKKGRKVKTLSAAAAGDVAKKAREVARA